MMNGIQFQSVQTPNALSSELRSVIRDNVLQFYVQGNGMDAQEEGITALYERLSQEDKLDGESNSIANQDGICQGVFLRNRTSLQKSQRVCPKFCVTTAKWCKIESKY